MARHSEFQCTHPRSILGQSDRHKDCFHFEWLTASPSSNLVVEGTSLPCRSGVLHVPNAPSSMCPMVERKANPLRSVRNNKNIKHGFKPQGEAYVCASWYTIVGPKLHTTWDARIQGLRCSRHGFVSLSGSESPRSQFYASKPQEDCYHSHANGYKNYIPITSLLMVNSSTVHCSIISLTLTVPYRRSSILEAAFPTSSLPLYLRRQ